MRQFPAAAPTGRPLILLAVAFALLLGGCAKPPRPQAPPPVPATIAAEPRDLRDIPQDVSGLLAQSGLDPDAPLLAPEAQAGFLARLRAAHFGPWGQANATFGRAAALWGLDKLAPGRYFGENLRPLEPGFQAEMEAQCRAASYPSLALPAIATANTSLRVLPTIRPGFLKPTRPGEGFPFDYWQNSGVWAGTPLMVTHLSADGAWALVEARNAGGWVRVADIAYVDEAFMARWKELPLLAVTREHTPVSGLVEVRTLERGEAPRWTGREAFLFQGRIGTVLPLVAQDADGYTALAPARNADGRAVSLVVRLPKDAAAAMPLVATPRNFGRLADQMLGQPYGWGGYLDNRDCSALLVDLYAPFGVFLPRNSTQQAKSGEVIGFNGLANPEREALLRARGVPFLTLLRKPGHILLYLGQLPEPNGGRAAMLHAVWGLKTLDADGVEGRLVLGRTVITTLEPGRELPDVARAGTLLTGMTGMTLLAPGGQPPAGPDRIR